MDPWPEWTRVWRAATTVLGLVLSVWASGHAVAYKRDPRAATLWVGVVWLLPLVGAVLYFLFGVNRINRWAESLRGGMERFRSTSDPAFVLSGRLEAALPEGASHLTSLARAIDSVVDRPLLCGNCVEPLLNGDAAYPAMIEVIRSATRSISLTTYIFDADEAGRMFVDALGDAVRRGVQVRVLVDATGARYSWPSIIRYLRRAGVPHERFLRPFPVRRLLAMNLRNHRKILVADGHTGFTGGLNIRMGHWLGRNPARPVQDLHFRVAGPVVGQLQEVFVEDWQFTTGESLRGEAWFPPLEARGPVLARGIADGPDEDFDKLRWSLLAALASARKRVRVVTPYFLPERALVAAMNVAALRGISVEIVLPSRSNLPLVQAASRAHWWQFLEHGCRIWLSPPPFDHTKLLLVDDAWAFVGSANWDSRSLRLNFEFNLECYDRGLVENLTGLFEAKRQAASEITLADVDGRSLPGRLRDGVARLFSPFL